MGLVLQYNYYLSFCREHVVKDDVCEELKDTFYNDMKMLRSRKKETELEINNRAKADLEKRVQELPVFTFIDTTGISYLAY